LKKFFECYRTGIHICEILFQITTEVRMVHLAGIVPDAEVTAAVAVAVVAAEVINRKKPPR